MHCPEYYNRFKCLAGECPDSCCRAGWEITIDEDTYGRCIQKLGDYFADRITQGEDGDRIYKLNKQGNCPFLNEQGLCELYIKTGEMTEICTNYPRFYEEFDGFTEAGVSISCPEAQRLIFSADTQDYRFTGEHSDDELLNSLLNHQEKAYDITDIAETPEKALIKILLDAYSFQEYIDTGIPAKEYSADEIESSDINEVLKSVCEMILDSTDILYDSWTSALGGDIRIKKIDISKRKAYLKYLIYRYYLKAINREDILSQAELIAVLYLLPLSLDGDYDTLCRIAAKEIEHDCENRDVLLDSIYSCEYFYADDIIGVLKAISEE